MSALSDKMQEFSVGDTVDYDGHTCLVIEHHLSDELAILRLIDCIGRTVTLTKLDDISRVMKL